MSLSISTSPPVRSISAVALIMDLLPKTLPSSDSVIRIYEEMREPPRELPMDEIPPPNRDPPPFIIEPLFITVPCIRYFDILVLLLPPPDPTL